MIKLVGLFQYCIYLSLGVEKKVKRNLISPRLETRVIYLFNTLFKPFVLKWGQGRKERNTNLVFKGNTYFHFFIMAVLTRNTDIAELYCNYNGILQQLLVTLSKIPYLKCLNNTTS